MRRLEGVIDSSRLPDADGLKKHSLFFDKMHLIEVRGLQSLYDMMHTSGIRDTRRTEAELQYLQDQGFISSVNDTAYLDLMRMMKTSNELDRWFAFVDWSNKVTSPILGLSRRGRLSFQRAGCRARLP